MRKIQLSLLALTALFATGCPKYKPSVDFNKPNSLAYTLNERLKTVQEQYWCYRSGFSYVAGKCDPTRPIQNGPEMAKAVRNDFIESAISFLDDGYNDYINGLQRGRDRGNFVADVVELGTSAAVGITKGERAIQILGVALTAFRGGRRSADLNFYKEQTTPILISKMDGNRADVRITILNREKDNVDTYPIGAAISEIVDYYNAGTLVRAFTELAKDTAAETKQSENNVLALKGVPITTEATPEFRNLSVAASDILTGLEDDLAGQDATKKAAATTRLIKIVKALEKDQAAAAALRNANVSSADTDGVKLKDALIDIRRSAALVNDTALLNTINHAIVDIN
jgi:hypothetical protein